MIEKPQIPEVKFTNCPHCGKEDNCNNKGNWYKLFKLGETFFTRTKYAIFKCREIDHCGISLYYEFINDTWILRHTYILKSQKKLNPIGG